MVATSTIVAAGGLFVPVYLLLLDIRARQARLDERVETLDDDLDQVVDEIEENVDDIDALQDRVRS